MDVPKFKIGDKVRFIEYGQGQLSGCVIGVRLNSIYQKFGYRYSVQVGGATSSRVYEELEEDRLVPEGCEQQDVELLQLTAELSLVNKRIVDLEDARTKLESDLQLVKSERMQLRLKGWELEKQIKKLKKGKKK